MFGTIRRHQSWLWVIVATITIVSFVIFGPTNTRLADSLKGGAGGAHDTIDGHPISQYDFEQTAKECVLEGILRNQQMARPDAPEILVQTWQRLLLIQKQKDLGIQITGEAAAKEAQRILQG